MRVPILILVFAFLVCCSAFTADEAPPAPSPGIPSFRYGGPVSRFASSRNHSPARHYGRRYSLRTGDLKSDSNYCYTMHSFLVSREGPASDAVNVVGETTCTPADRFQFRATVEPAPAPQR